MKRISIFIVALLAIAVMSSFTSSGILKRDRMLTDLWIEYGRASENDEVRDMADILEKIKGVALENRFSEDYFRACEEYVNTMSRRNWKLTERLIASATEELHSYGEPILEIFFGFRHGQATDSLAAKVARYADAMKEARNIGIYKKYGYAIFNFIDAERFNSMMSKSIADDYEFILWSFVTGRGYESRWAYEELAKCLDGRYPEAPYLRFLEIRNEPDRDKSRAGLEKLAEEYAGRGMGIAAEDMLLWLRFNEIDGKATSDEYRSLEKDVAAFERRRKALKGDEKDIAELSEMAPYILETLRSEGVAVRIEDGDGKLLMRNMDRAKFVIKRGEDVLFETAALNGTGSFYKYDTVKVDIPLLDDGEYMVSVYDGAEELIRTDYEKYTVSLAGRMAADGMCVYAADYLSGKPVDKADLILYDRLNEVVAEVKDFEFDGFTPLPEEIYPFKDNRYHYLVCRYEEDGVEHVSRRMSFANQKLMLRTKSMLMSRVVTDRAAFVPGDTVNFKVFMYDDRPDGTMATSPEGEEVIVHVVDPEGNVASEMKLYTNEFGSAAGGYAIDGKGRNGRWEILVMSPRYAAKAAYFTVDDFVLPSYDLAFEQPERLYFPGDTVKVRGRVRNFTGHGFGGLSAVAEITVKHKFVAEEQVVIAPDGSFEIAVATGGGEDDYVSYGITVKIADMTGETLEFSHVSTVSKSVNPKASLLNRDTGRFALSNEKNVYRGMVGDGLLSEDVARFKFMLNFRGKEIPDIPVDYELKLDGRTVRSGTVKSGDTLNLDMSGLAPGYYELEQKVSLVSDSGIGINSSNVERMLYMPETNPVTPERVGVVFRTSYDDGLVTMQLGSGTGPKWAVVELFGNDAVPLKKRILYLEGKAGEIGSLETLSFPHLEEYTDKLLLNVFFFRNGDGYSLEERFSRPETGHDIPLEFVSFEDKALPGQNISIVMKTSPEAEVLAAVFDASSEKIAGNIWNVRSFYEQNPRAILHYANVTGRNGSSGFPTVVAYGTKARGASKTGAVMESNVLMMDSSAEEDDAVPFRRLETAEAESAGSVIRDDFANTLAFEPFLRPSEDGTVELKFRTSDKLSTFIVRVLAHDKSMNTAIAGREMLVTLPVKVSVVSPQYLYAGDEYVLKASVSNSSASDVKGKIHFELYGGGTWLDEEPVRTDYVEIDVPGGESVAVGFGVDVPADVDTLGLKVVFAGHEYSDETAVNDAVVSDGIFVPVPVHPAEQILTEAHSAVLLGGRSAEDLLERLGNEFVNVSSVGAEYSEISIADMLHEALPVAYEAEADDAVSLSEAMYVNFMAANLRSGDDTAVRECVAAAMGSVSKLLACANPDGGFGWFDGMPSSPVVTAVVLERVAGLREGGLLDVASHVWGEDSLDDLDFAVPEAVKYLDLSYFGDSERPMWYGRLSLGQYMNVRSMYSGVDFDEDAARKAMGRKKYKEFQKDVKAYVIPEGVSGDVLYKVRKVRVITRLLNGTPEGFAILKAWGLSSTASVRKMVKARDRELRSLKQYAVEHPSGGVYYPNAVMPWRGLLESEAYAHAQICDLFRDVAGEYFGDDRMAGLADGVRIWLMVQKETQKWSADPGFVDALASVYEGSDVVKSTRVMVLKKRYSKPFDEIKAAGNGFRVSVDCYKAGLDGARVRLEEGDSLHVGDKITAVYSLWSEENRSHVRLSVPRAACFRPADQLSGWSGGWFRPLRYGALNVSPYSYREVKSDRTLYWIDVFPEENTTIEEELFVTQKGSFTAPVAELESIYAPHYRANEEHRKPVEAD